MSEWISVDDRLPEDRASVLITNGSIVGHARIVENGYFGPIFGIIASNDRVPSYNVTHWMPLPTPPEAK